MNDFYKIIPNRNTFIALTALWALVESGLGGIMHAFHLPFTGIFLGGFSVLIVSLMAYFEKKPFSQILKATLIVMAVKVSVNPATSPMAYIAVGFQGLCGAFIYSLPFRNLAVSMIFALLAMLESALQKLLILTVLFGTQWMKALDVYFNSIGKTFGVAKESPFSLYVVLFYLFVYCIWGLLLGIWAHRLPQQLIMRAHLYEDLQPKVLEKVPARPRKNRGLFFIIVVLLLIMVYTFFKPGTNPYTETMIIIFRTTTVVVCWVFLVMPLWRKVVQKWLIRQKHEEMPEVLQLIPRISSYIKPLYQQVSVEKKGIHKWKEFVLGLMVISLKQDGQIK